MTTYEFDHEEDILQPLSNLLYGVSLEDYRYWRENQTLRLAKYKPKYNHQHLEHKVATVKLLVCGHSGTKKYHPNHLKPVSKGTVYLSDGYDYMLLQRYKEINLEINRAMNLVARAKKNALSRIKGFNFNRDPKTGEPVMSFFGEFKNKEQEEDIERERMGSKQEELLFMVSTTDFFFPNCDDPYLMGKIACANVLSDLYSFGIADCDNMLMILAGSTDMTPEQRTWSTRGMINGFNDNAKIAGTNITGGQTVKNPWPIIGGVATSVVKKDEFIMPVGAVAGDVLVLTKPLGTQVCANAHQWLQGFPEKWERITGVVTREQIIECWAYAVNSMARLNRTGARMMMKHGAHACTDVTGFGLLGHSMNLAKNQNAAVYFEIDTLPIMQGMVEIDATLNYNYNLLKGMSAETSGGLLVALPADKAQAFIDDMQEIDKQPAWIIGKVKASDKPQSENYSYLVDNLNIINVLPNNNF
ncbi:selenide water dikinase [Cavenderia fasciculata]|uniref:Selenide water dikinase n=1 Tax=Cavenderia fasciculata TaxID=261658 RepID=F4QF23_CACFS|nr:selenide water dikinase [Cavenderia fasciculata]EGG13382.1 selenide water dikinase [Cavenderia fasciculata]|eukprot:XP_004350086.1 selenide water dikinase [Cavenderia fasciculata]